MASDATSNDASDASALFPLPSSMTTADALKIVAQERGWTAEEMASDLQVLHRERLRTIGDCRSLGKDSWKEIKDVPLIVRDNLRRLAWAEVAAAGPKGEVISKKQYKQMEAEFRKKVEEAQQHADATGAEVEVENPMRAGLLSSLGTFTGVPTLVRGRKPPPPPAVPPPPPGPPGPYYPYPAPPPGVAPPSPPPVAATATPAASLAAGDDEAVVVGKIEDLQFGKK
ncbi:hypothetical protein DFJ74DRAFT_667459 [Hyaloraphidium curvatum]|nr:hypothetical protein DFJ74DRAFT_667459 [Hyaloraphidium curvatum]